MSERRERTISTAKRVREEGGAALVEFALVIPVLMIVVMASLSLLWMLTARSALSGAARDGARFASIRHDFVCDDAPCDTSWPTQDEVASYVRDRAGKFSVESVEVDPPTHANDAVAVTVKGKLPVLLQPLGMVFGDLEYTTTSKARAE